MSILNLNQVVFLCKLVLIFGLLSFFTIYCPAQQSKIDSLETIIKTAAEDTNKVNILNEIANLQRDNAPTKAVEPAMQALILATKINFQTGKGLANIALGIANTNLGKYAEATQYLQNGIKICIAIGDDKNLARAYTNMGNVCLGKSNYAEALNNYFAALKIREKTNDKNGLATTYINIGNAYNLQGKYPEALKNYLAGLKIHEDHGNKRGIAYAYNNIGVIYRSQHNYPEALKIYLSSLKVKEEIGDKKGIGVAYINIGEIYEITGNYPEAMKNYFASLKIREEIKDKQGIASTYENIANVFTKQSNFSDALKNHFISLKICEEIGDLSGTAKCYNEIGMVYTKQNKFIEAGDYLNKGLKVSREIGSKDISNQSYQGLTLLDSSTGDWKAAFEHQKMFVVFRDSLINEKTTKKTDSLQMQFLFEKQQDSLKAENSKREYAMQKELQLQQLQYEFEQKQEQTKSEKEKQQLKFEEEIKRRKIESVFEQKRIRTEEEQNKREALFKVEQDKKDALKQAEIENQKTTKKFILFGAGSLIIFTVIGFGFYKRKRDADLKQKDAELRQQVSELEMKALRAQMNPHFIFNSMQSIRSFIDSKETESANEYLTKFAKLIRMILEKSNKQEIIIYDDIKALEMYMQLESLRLQYGFDYEINIDPKIDTENTLIPPMILQPFVENAIWHGLHHKTERGKIIINILRIGEELECVIEDNGVGRKKAQVLKQKPMEEKKESLGMKITKERINLFNSLKNSKAFFEIVDLYNAEKLPEGVRVILHLPFEEAS